MPSTFHESETGQAVIENTTLIGSELKVNWASFFLHFMADVSLKFAPHQASKNRAKLRTAY
jgi:hypothetical protein